MNDSKYLDSCIQILKGMLEDQSNEWESEAKRVLSSGIRKLRMLKKQARIKPEELYRTVSDIAKAVSEIM